MCNDSNDVKQKLEDSIKFALNMLYEKDRYLISNRPDEHENENHVSERGIVSKFAHYLEKYFLENNLFEEYDVDVEYNRNMSEAKYLKSFSKGTYPDLIIHKRGTNEKNLLVIEFKTWWNKKNEDIERDKKKIKGFMDKNDTYQYKYGLFILIGKECPDEIEWMSDK